ncbi:MAG: hypothetical protein JSR17_09285 [Proteobacteria bacterium]|nr:hypothetical protein [Pseudomonadota bacterium]
MTIEFKNCKYHWQLQETLKTEFDNLTFEDEKEFDLVASLIQDALGEPKEPLSPDANLNERLRADLANVLSYYNSPSEHISADFVKSNLKLFGLEQPATEAQCFSAHQALVKEILKEKASLLASLTSAQRQELIKNKAQSREERKKEAAALQSKVPPAPGSEGSTHTLFLTQMLGGQERFKAIGALLKASPNISEFTDSLGQYTGILTDEEGLRWQLDIFAASNKDLSINVKNYDALRLNPEQPQNIIAQQSVVSFEDIPNQFFPKMPFQYKNETICDLLLSKINKLVFVAFCMSYGMTNEGLNKKAVKQEMQRMLDSDIELTRAQIKERLNACVQEPQPQIPANLFDLIRNLGQILEVGPGADVDDEGAGAELPAGMTFIPPGAMPVLFNALFGSEDSSDDQPAPRRNPPRQARHGRRH